MPKNPLNLQGKSAIWRPSPEAAFALFGGALATALSAAAAGRTLGEVIGGLVAAALIGPPLAARRIGWIEQMKTMAGLVVGISAIWLSLIGPTGATIDEWICLAGVLAGFVFLLTGMTALLIRMCFHGVLAAAICVLIGFAWLSWPIWLSGAMTAPP